MLRRHIRMISIATTRQIRRRRHILKRIIMRAQRRRVLESVGAGLRIRVFAAEGGLADFGEDAGEQRLEHGERGGDDADGQLDEEPVKERVV